MQKKDISGRWKLIEIEYPPVEPGDDDGGFADEGMGSSLGADGLGLGSAFLELSAGGDLKGKYWRDESGSWRIEDDRLVIAIDGDDIELTLHDGLLERPDFDEEHGRRMIVRYEAVKAKAKGKAKKLTKKTQKAIDRVWGLICECDHIEEKDVEKALDEGGQAAADYMQGPESDVWILTAAISNRDWPLAKRLIDHGLPLRFEQDDVTLAEHAAERASHQKDPAERAAGEEVAALIRERSGE